MSSKAKIIILISVLAVAALIFIFVAGSKVPPGASQQTSPAGQENNQQPTAARSGTVDNPPPPPVFQTSERVFEVISGGADSTYRVRELSSQKELDLFMPSDANITAGTRESIQAGAILTVQRFMELANGVIATELSISTAQ